MSQELKYTGPINHNGKPDKRSKEWKIFVQQKKNLDQKNLDNLNKKINEYELIIDELKNTVSEYEKCKDANANLEMISSIKTLEERNKELVNQSQMLIEDFANNKNKIDELEQTLHTSTTTCSQSEELIVELQEQNDLLKEESSITIASNNKLSIENKSLREKNNDLLKQVEINKIISKKLQIEIQKNKQYDIIFYNRLPIISLAVSLLAYYFLNAGN